MEDLYSEITFLATMEEKVTNLPVLSPDRIES
jgi:hypothetical protein